MLIGKMNLQKKIGPLSELQPEKIMFPLNLTDIPTDGHKYMKSSFATKNVRSKYKPEKQDQAQDRNHQHHPVFGQDLFAHNDQV